MKKLTIQPIYLHAAIALLTINLLHKIVRELPTSLPMLGQKGITGYPAILSTLFLIISIFFLSFKKKIGIYLGFIPAAWAIIQEFISHIVLKHEIVGVVVWYPIFTLAQGCFILYFLIWILRENKNVLDIK